MFLLSGRMIKSCPCVVFGNSCVQLGFNTLKEVLSYGIMKNKEIKSVKYRDVCLFKPTDHKPCLNVAIYRLISFSSTFDVTNNSPVTTLKRQKSVSGQLKRLFFPLFYKSRNKSAFDHPGFNICVPTNLNKKKKNPR